MYSSSDGRNTFFKIQTSILLCVLKYFFKYIIFYLKILLKTIF